ncbi:hypothetical protein C8J57DRAFT_1245891 [Mycena rebaudengoi]|nr:hypothetical protein C8J57DRAFT_1245891 [Mycena rebaudengoi]
MPENVRELPCSRLWELLAAKGGTEKFGQELPDELGAPPDVTSCSGVRGPFLPKKAVFAVFRAWTVPGSCSWLVDLALVVRTELQAECQGSPPYGVRGTVASLWKTRFQK